METKCLHLTLAVALHRRCTLTMTLGAFDQTCLMVLCDLTQSDWHGVIGLFCNLTWSLLIVMFCLQLLEMTNNVVQLKSPQWGKPPKVVLGPLTILQCIRDIQLRLMSHMTIKGTNPIKVAWSLKLSPITIKSFKNKLSTLRLMVSFSHCKKRTDGLLLSWLHRVGCLPARMSILLPHSETVDYPPFSHQTCLSVTRDALSMHC